MAAHCPISRDDFRQNAEPVNVTINGMDMVAEVKEFATGSLGWYLNGKVSMPVGGKNVQVQIGLNLTILGSKALPMDNAPADASSDA